MGTLCGLKEVSGCREVMYSWYKFRQGLGCLNSVVHFSWKISVRMLLGCHESLLGRQPSDRLHASACDPSSASPSDRFVVLGDLGQKALLM